MARARGGQYALVLDGLGVETVKAVEWTPADSDEMVSFVIPVK